MTFQYLFNYLYENFDVTATSGEMHEIENIIKEINKV
jgi:hypothetical protein